ncbi:unnamed protein product [Penicillium olsonii]|uniref:Uncharacterized protein n=1 Tax=Penicillium olsonii TaxID=99116 RepID=A0A9W4N707_PENOL|nr:unnamed protein product [Penicillium olsonii]CAG8276183.1 unnamed protein product [Penicillium olsonii]
MRLRSNHVLEPVAERQPPRRRRGTRGSSAQPEPEAAPKATDPEPTSTSAKPTRKGRPAKKSKAKKASQKDELVSSPNVSPSVSRSVSPSVRSLASTDDEGKTPREARYARRQLKRSPTMMLALSPVAEEPSSSPAPLPPQPAHALGLPTVESPTRTTQYESPACSRVLFPVTDAATGLNAASQSGDIFYTPAVQHSVPATVLNPAIVSPELEAVVTPSAPSPKPDVFNATTAQSPVLDHAEFSPMADVFYTPAVYSPVLEPDLTHNVFSTVAEVSSPTVHYPVLEAYSSPAESSPVSDAFYTPTLFSPAAEDVHTLVEEDAMEGVVFSIPTLLEDVLDSPPESHVGTPIQPNTRLPSLWPSLMDPRPWIFPSAFTSQPTVGSPVTDQAMTSAEHPFEPHGEAQSEIPKPPTGLSAQPNSRRMFSQPAQGRRKLKPFFYCPKGYIPARRFDISYGNQLTNRQDESRKRTRSDEEETPVKRYKLAQAITPRGSLIHPRPRTTYADRTRRRQAEVGGRIHSTMFRVPEYLAQKSADARSAPPPNDTESQDQTTAAPTSALPLEDHTPAATPGAPSSPGWGRWMVDGVSRRLTSLVSRQSSPQRGNTLHNHNHEQRQVQHEAGPDHHNRNVNINGTSSSASAQPSIRDTATSTTLAVKGSKQDPSQGATAGSRNRYGGYDLFGAGFTAEQRARWHINTAPAPTSSVSTAPITAATNAAPAPVQPHTPAHEEPVSSKRKRQPTPEVIPNPPGCSYGLNDDYFIYSDDEWDAQEASGANIAPGMEPSSSNKVSAQRSPNSNKQGQSKTPDSSSRPEKRASKRARVERPPNFNYAGHFEVPYSSSEASSSTRSTPLPTAGSSSSPEKPASPEKRVSRRSRVERPPNFNHAGHFEVPYSSSDTSGSPQSNQRSSPPTNQRSSPQSNQSSSSLSRFPRDGGSDVSVDDVDQQRHQAQSTPRKGQEFSKTSPPDTELIKRARKQAEQYKPKTPSRLRAAHRFSSSNTSLGNSLVGQHENVPPTEDPAIRRRRLMRRSTLAGACPRGDFNNIAWPEFDTWGNRLRSFIDDNVVSSGRRHLGKLRPEKQGAVNARFKAAVAKRRAGERVKASAFKFEELWRV